MMSEYWFRSVLALCGLAWFVVLGTGACTIDPGGGGNGGGSTADDGGNGGGGTADDGGSATDGSTNGGESGEPFEQCPRNDGSSPEGAADLQPQDCSSFKSLDRGVSSDRRLTEDCYEASSGLDVASEATLTIEPGVVIRFGEDSEFRIGGTINASGTPDKPILLTGTDASAGSWQGVRLRNTSSTDNMLDHVIVEYGGGGADDARHANLELQGVSTGTSALALTNSILRESADLGLETEGSVTFPDFQSNTITNNDAAAGLVSANNLTALDGETSYTGNGTDAVRVARSTVRQAAVTSNQTWSALGVPLRFQGNVTVQEEAEITVGKCSQLRFEEGTKVTASGTGSLAIAGAENQRVLLAGTKDEAGWWAGLVYNNSDHSSNAVEYAVLENGGGAEKTGNLTLTSSGVSSSSATVNNVTFRNSGGAGIWAGGNEFELRGCSNLLFENTDPAATISDEARGARQLQQSVCE